MNIYPVKAFTEEALIKIINEELDKTRFRVRVKSIISVDDFNCLFDTNTDKKILVQFVFRGGDAQIRVRAIHRIKNQRKPYTYLFNGQGGKNLETLIYNGEEGKCYSVSRKQLNSYFLFKYGNQLTNEQLDKLSESAMEIAA